MQLRNSAKTAKELENELGTINQKKQTAMAAREHAENDFQTAWNNAIDGFAAKLPALEIEVRNKIHEHVNNLQLVGGLTRKLPSIMREMVETHLASYRQELQRMLGEAAESLDSEALVFSFFV